MGGLSDLDVYVCVGYLFSVLAVGIGLTAVHYQRRRLLNQAIQHALPTSSDDILRDYYLGQALPWWALAFYK